MMSNEAKMQAARETCGRLNFLSDADLELLLVHPSDTEEKNWSALKNVFDNCVKFTIVEGTSDQIDARIDKTGENLTFNEPIVIN